MRIYAKDYEEREMIHSILACRDEGNFDVWFNRLTRAQRKKVSSLLQIMAAVDADDTCLGVLSEEERNLLDSAISCQTLFDKSEFLSSVEPGLKLLAEHFVAMVEISRLYEDENYHPDNFMDALEVISKIKTKL